MPQTKKNIESKLRYYKSLIDSYPLHPSKYEVNSVDLSSPDTLSSRDSLLGNKVDSPPLLGISVSPSSVTGSSDLDPNAVEVKTERDKLLDGGMTPEEVKSYYRALDTKKLKDNGMTDREINTYYNAVDRHEYVKNNPLSEVPILGDAADVFDETIKYALDFVPGINTHDLSPSEKKFHDVVSHDTAENFKRHLPNFLGNFGKNVIANSGGVLGSALMMLTPGAVVPKLSAEAGLAVASIVGGFSQASSKFRQDLREGKSLSEANVDSGINFVTDSMTNYFGGKLINTGGEKVFNSFSKVSKNASEILDNKLIVNGIKSNAVKLAEKESFNNAIKGAVAQKVIHNVGDSLLNVAQANINSVSTGGSALPFEKNAELVAQGLLLNSSIKLASYGNKLYNTAHGRSFDNNSFTKRVLRKAEDNMLTGKKQYVDVKSAETLAKSNEFINEIGRPLTESEMAKVSDIDLESSAFNELVENQLANILGFNTYALSKIFGIDLSNPVFLSQAKAFSEVYHNTLEDMNNGRALDLENMQRDYKDYVEKNNISDNLNTIISDSQKKSNVDNEIANFDGRSADVYGNLNNKKSIEGKISKLESDLDSSNKSIDKVQSNLDSVISNKKDLESIKTDITSDLESHSDKKDINSYIDAKKESLNKAISEKTKLEDDLSKPKEVKPVTVSTKSAFNNALNKVKKLEEKINRGNRIMSDNSMKSLSKSMDKVESLSKKWAEEKSKNQQELDSKIKNTKDSISNLENKIESLKGDIKSSEESIVKVDALTEELKQINTDIDNASNKKSKLTNDLSSKKYSNNRIKENIRSNKSKIFNVENKIKRKINSKLRSLKKLRSSLDSHIRDANYKVEKYREGLKKHKEIIDINVQKFRDEKNGKDSITENISEHIVNKALKKFIESNTPDISSLHINPKASENSSSDSDSTQHVNAKTPENLSPVHKDDELYSRVSKVVDKIYSGLKSKDIKLKDFDGNSKSFDSAKSKDMAKSLLYNIVNDALYSGRVRKGHSDNKVDIKSEKDFFDNFSVKYTDMLVSSDGRKAIDFATTGKFPGFSTSEEIKLSKEKYFGKGNVSTEPNTSEKLDSPSKALKSNQIELTTGKENKSFDSSQLSNALVNLSNGRASGAYGEDGNFVSGSASVNAKKASDKIQVNLYKHPTDTKSVLNSSMARTLNHEFNHLLRHSSGDKYAQVHFDMLKKYLKRLDKVKDALLIDYTKKSIESLKTVIDAKKEIPILEKKLERLKKLPESKKNTDDIKEINRKLDLRKNVDWDKYNEETFVRNTEMALVDYVNSNNSETKSFIRKLRKYFPEAISNMFADNRIDSYIEKNFFMGKNQHTKKAKSFKTFKRDWFTKVYGDNYVDRAKVLLDLNRINSKNNLDNVDPTFNPHDAFYQVLGSSGRKQSFLLHGINDLFTSAVGSEKMLLPYTPTKIISNFDELFKNYAVSQIEKTDGKSSLSSLSSKLMDFINDPTDNISDPHVKKIVDEFNNYMNGLYNYALNSGISPTNNISKNSYLSLIKMFDVSPHQDILQALSEMNEKVIDASDRNRLMLSIVNSGKGVKNFSDITNLQDSEGVFKVTDSKNDSANIVRGHVIGKNGSIDPKAVHVTFSEDIKKVIDSLNKDDSLLSAILSYPEYANNIFKNIINHAPTFIITNPFKDLASGVGNTRSNKIDFILNAFSSIKDSYKDVGFSNATESTKTRESGGGGIVDIAGERQKYSSAVSDFVSDFISKNSNIVTDRSTWKDTFSKIFSRYHEVIMASESVTRNTEFKSAYKMLKKKYPSQPDNVIKLLAVKEANGLLNYSMVGYHMRQINKLIPFSATAARSLHRIFEGFSTTESGEITQSSIKEMIKKHSPLFFAAYVLPRVILRAIQGSDEEEELPAYARDFGLNINWNKITGGAVNHRTYIPLGYEHSVLGSMFLRAYDSMAKNDPLAYKGLTESVLRSFYYLDASSAAYPIMPLAELGLNHSFFTGDKIFGDSVSKDKASLWSKRLGSDIIDPNALDYGAKALFPYWGKAVVNSGKEAITGRTNRFISDITGLSKVISPYSMVSVRDILDNSSKYKPYQVRLLKRSLNKWYHDKSTKNKNNIVKVARNITKRK